MKNFVLSVAILLSTVANSATDFSELNTKAAELLGEAGKAQKELSELLLDKMGTDWGFSEALILSSVKTLAESKYRVEFPDDKACNPWPELLEGAKYREAMEEQAKQAVNFLGDYHARNLGMNRSLFKIRNIQLCTGSHYWNSKRIEFDRFKSALKVSVGPSRLALVGNGSFTKDNVVTLTADEIKTKWTDGEMWEADTYIKNLIDKNKNPVRQYWPFLNPISEIRVALREIFRQDGLKLAQLIRGWLIQDDLSLQTGLITTARKFADGDQVVERLKKLSGTAAMSLGHKWADKLADPKASENMSVATIVGVLKKHVEKQKQAPGNVKIERKQIGIVNVENFHDIDVDFTTGDAKAFQEQIIVPENIDIKVSQVGIVNVSTTDRVSVSVALGALSSGDAFERATLSSILKEFKEE